MSRNLTMNVSTGIRRKEYVNWRSSARNIKWRIALKTERSSGNMLKESMKKTLKTKTWRGKYSHTKIGLLPLSKRWIISKIIGKTMRYLWSKLLIRSKPLSKTLLPLLKTLTTKKWWWKASLDNWVKKLFLSRTRAMSWTARNILWKKITTSWSNCTKIQRKKFLRRSTSWKSWKRLDEVASLRMSLSIRVILNYSSWSKFKELLTWKVS